MLEGFVEPQLRRLGIDPTALHFQQDGATAHTARNSMAVVRECSELFNSILLPTLCTYLIKNYRNSHLKPHMLKMSVMHN